MYKLLVAYVDRRSQVIGGRWSRLHALRGKRGSLLTSLWWHTLIVAHKPLVAYVDRRLQAFGDKRGSSFTSLWWQR